MLTTPTPPTVSSAHTDDATRDYAFHFHEQSGRTQGHDLDNWQEANACLKANIPAHRSHNRLHDHTAAFALDALPTPRPTPEAGSNKHVGEIGA